jgi:hypothetical protein
MGKLFIDSLDSAMRPLKRGDLVQSNVGQPRERTWMILRAKPTKGKPRRFQVWMARWWELEPEMRMRLYESATRNGGQQVIFFRRYPAKKKKRASAPDFFDQARPPFLSRCGDR